MNFTHRYETPVNVASLLARWVPRHIDNILEPAVGDGILLKPLLQRFNKQGTSIVCVDTDKTCLARVDKRIGQNFSGHFYALHGDFLSLARKQHPLLKGGFDCILMNPPFAARRSDCVSAKISPRDATEGLLVRSVPVEAAFLLAVIKLLRPNGRLLSVVSSAVICGSNGSWLREYLLKLGQILYVHELPKYLFENVNGHTYVMAFDKKVSRKRITLCNHRLVKPDRVSLSKDSLGKGSRLDYKFQDAQTWHQRLQTRLPNVSWTPLGQIAEVYRGAGNSPGGAKCSLHTTDFSRGFWQSRRLNKTKGKRKPQSSKSAMPSDLLIARVRRDCTTTLGRIVGRKRFDCSDCVLIIRPRKAKTRDRLLFTLRCLLGFDEVRNLIERGSAAQYIGKDDLEALSIPIGLDRVFARLYVTYREAIKLQNFTQMLAIEETVRNCLRNKLLGKDEFK